MYHKPSLLVGATVLFCTFAVPLSCSPKHLFKHQALILSSSSLDTSLRPDRATSCPLSWASMPVRLNSSHSICFINFVFLLFHICHTRSPIAVYISHVHKQHALWRLHWDDDDDDDNVLLGVLWSSWAESEEDLPLRELAVVSCPFITSVVF